MGCKYVISKGSTFKENIMLVIHTSVCCYLTFVFSCLIFVSLLLWANNTVGKFLVRIFLYSR